MGFVTIRHRVAFGAIVSVAAFSGCSTSGMTPGGALSLSQAVRGAHHATLGPVIRTANGGSVTGWAIDENGSDGVLSEAVPKGSGYVSYVETFDQTTDKITKTVKTQVSANGDDDLVVGGATGQDVGLIDDERESFPGGTRHDIFHLMDPISGERFTKKWRLPHPAGMLLQDMSDQQSDPLEALLFLDNNVEPGRPEVVVSDVAANKFKKIMHFLPGVIWYGPELIAEDYETHHAIGPTQYLGGSAALVFDDFDLETGKVSSFLAVSGVGPFEGVAIDSTTHMMCTTTQGDYSVEFYSLTTEKGFAEQLPGADSEQQSGEEIAADTINHLFLVIQPVTSFSPPEGSVLVYDEAGSLRETISGLSTLIEYYPVNEHVQVNAATRTGFVVGPAPNEIQSFSY